MFNVHCKPTNRAAAAAAMGRELSCFVDGNNVSRHLLCSICHGVLEAPVQTACEHLFCEEELVEWMCHGNRCPVCAAELVAEEVVRAPRAIVGLIEDLECHCAYAIHGCPWTGDSAAARVHGPSCEFAPREALVENLEAATRALDEAKRRNAAQERELARGARRVRELRRFAPRDPTNFLGHESIEGKSMTGPGARRRRELPTRHVGCSQQRVYTRSRVMTPAPARRTSSRRCSAAPRARRDSRFRRTRPRIAPPRGWTRAPRRGPRAVSYTHLTLPTKA